MAGAWSSFAEQVRDIGSRIYGQALIETTIADCRVDAYAEIAPDYAVVVVCASDTHKTTVQKSLDVAIRVKSSLLKSGKFAKCFIVVRGKPNPSSIMDGEKLNVIVSSVSSFAALLIEYQRYSSARKSAPFGSAVDPQTGEIDRISYVPVTYKNRLINKDYKSSDIAAMLSLGNKVILLGEYGSGKSRCISEIYDEIAKVWGDTLSFPFAINLRECWGMQSAEEIIRRHILRLGLDETLENAAVRVFRRKSGVYLLDGFDELGSQAWSSDEEKLKGLRASALTGVRDIIRNSAGGCLIAGREHYFSSFAEMHEALGLKIGEAIVLTVNEEFSVEEMESYFEAAQINIALPSWLPRRPLICQTISQLDSDDIQRMFSERSREAEFWEYFIQIVCKRDSRINESFDPGVIFNVYVELARQSRNKQMTVGPFSLRDLQSAFESAVGQPPTEDASVMLQRLPSLGRIGAESTDRQFVDMYILDGLRARDIARLLSISEASRLRALDEQWVNPLGVLGQQVLAAHIDRRFDAFLALAVRSANSLNRVLSADIASSFLHIGKDEIDFGNLKIVGAVFGNLNFEITRASNMTIEDSVIEQLVLPSSKPTNVSIRSSSAGTVAGVTSFEALPVWAKLDTVDEFDSVQTVSRIREVGMSPAHQILVAIVKKTFFQRGAGRKEDALLRGFGGGWSSKTASRILNLLEREGILTTFKGDEGTVYAPVRAKANRMTKMLNELRSSTDEVWKQCAAL